MNHPNIPHVGPVRRFFMKPFLAIRFWWQHGPITPAAAERIDRIRNPKKYLSQVNAPEKL